MHATIPGGGHRLERVATMPDQEMNEIHIQITGNVPEHRSSFANSRQTRDKHRDRERERPADINVSNLVIISGIPVWYLNPVETDQKSCEIKNKKK